MTQVTTAPHELEGHWHFGDNGLGPYHLLTDTLLNEYDGYREFPARIDGERWEIQVNYSKSGIAARDQDAAADVLYEMELHITGFGERKCHYNISPRFEGMETPDGNPINNPLTKYVSEGIDVNFQGSNIAPRQALSLLGDVVQEIGDDAGRRINNSYFRSELLESSNFRTYERYLRITDTANRKLIGQTGLFRQIHHLLGSEKNAVADIRIDNETRIGKMHRIRLQPTAATKLISELGFGCQVKSYLLKNPDAVDQDNPTYHPKLGVLFKQGLNKGNSKPWSEIGQVEQQLDSLLLNVLEWADIPIRPDADVYVPDDHFTPDARQDVVRMYDDPTPEIDARQDSLLVTGLRDLTDADVDTLDALVTDGTGQDVGELADTTEYHISTIYRALSRMSQFLENDRDAGVSFRSQKLADEISDIVRSTEHQIKNGADRVARLYNLDDSAAASDAFRAWLSRYGAELETPPDNDGRMKIRIDTILTDLKSVKRPRVKDVLEAAEAAWKDTGGDIADFRNAAVRYRSGPESWTAANPNIILR